MKNIYKLFLPIFLLSCIGYTNAQWTNVSWTGAQVNPLKYVNGNLFAYAFYSQSDSGLLFMSTDSGASWQTADSAAFVYIYVHDITYDSAHSVYVMAANGQNGIYYSSDGLNWMQPGGNLWSGDGIVYINNQLVLSTGDDGVGISTDGGMTWTASNNGLYGPFYDHYVTSIGDTLYISGQGTVCFVSGDYGANWEPRIDSQNYFINCYYQHRGTVYAGLYLNGVGYYDLSLGYWKSYNEGLPLAYDDVSVSLETNALTDYGDTLFVGANSIGVWMNNTTTNNGWQDFSCGLPAQTSIYKLTISGNTLYAGTDNGLWAYNLSAACVATGLPVVTNDYTAEVFPTVTDGLINVRSSILPETIHVLNSEGQLVQVFDGASTSINIGNCAQGLYFVQMIWPDGQTVVKKVVKQL